MIETDDDRSEAERRALAELPRELAPRAEVEERIVSALRSRGGIRAVRRRWVLPVAAAAGLAALALAFLIGRGNAPPRAAAPTAPRFALFLLRGSERLPERPEEEAGRVSEYRDWARGLAHSGRFVTGEKLEDRGERLGASASAPAGPEEEIRGYFVISAADFQEALAVARACPHLRHGGTILVRPIARI